MTTAWPLIDSAWLMAVSSRPEHSRPRGGEGRESENAWGRWQIDEAYAIAYDLGHDDEDRNAGEGGSLPAAGSGGKDARAHRDHGSAAQWCSDLRGGLAGDSGDAPSPLDPRHARVDPEGLAHATFQDPVSYTHLRAHETPEHLVCRLLL